MGRKIAILGRCANTVRDAPFEDLSWEIWALAWDRVPRYDALFEIHEDWRDNDHQDGERGKIEHREWMRHQKVPVWMLREESDIPSSRALPMEAIKALIGTANNSPYPYLESSIAYMIALATLEGAEKIGLWGVDLIIKSEYAFQRPNMEYLIGLARGKGIKVYVPPQAALLTHERGQPYGYAQRKAS